jgi:ribosome maturation factor RimP
MTEESAIEARVEGLLQAPITGVGCRLLEVQFRREGRWMLRLLIDRDPQVTLEDCKAVSELAGRILDVEDPVPHAFSLEVSSPGLFRPLKDKRHFEQSIGKVVRLTVGPEALPDLKQRTVRGTLLEVAAETLRLEVDGQLLDIPLSAARSARLDPKL